MVKEREPPRVANTAKNPIAPHSHVPNASAANVSSTQGSKEDPYRRPNVASSSRNNSGQSYIDFTAPQYNATAKHVNQNTNGQSRSSNPFNVPKPGAPRPEHHRPAAPPLQQSRPVHGGMYMPSLPNQSAGFNSVSSARAPPPFPTNRTKAPSINDIMAEYGEVPPSKTLIIPPPGGGPLAGSNYNQARNPDAPIEISRPPSFAPKTIPAAPRPMYSSNPSGFQPVNAWKAPSTTSSNFMDLTHSPDVIKRDSDDHFDPMRALAGDSAFGAHDPSSYVDAAQASENIKALLEGAFDEDDEDKPKTRLRRRKPKFAEEDSGKVSLEAKLKALDVKEKQQEQKHEEEANDEEEEEDDGSVEGLSVKLLPHQIDGVAWMLDKEVGERKKNGVLPKGGILADDMGLGKTIQALALMLSNPRPTNEWIEQNPKQKFPKSAGRGTLVVAPLALIKQWEAEIKDKVSTDHKLKVLVHHGPSRTKRFDDLKKYDVVITTYQTLTSEHVGTSPDEHGIKVGCFGVHWYRIILDEAHSIKNRSAKMTQAAYNLKSVYRWCLTGTPMQNNLEELQSLIRFLQIKPYCELRMWKEQIGMPMKNGRGGLAMKRLQFFLKAFMKRRTKEILKQEGTLKFGKPSGKKTDADVHEAVKKDDGSGFKIVGRNIQSVIVDFSDSERSFYDKLTARTEKSLAQMMGGEKTDYIGALVLLLRLRQICNHPDLIRTNISKETDTLGGGGSQGPKPTKSTDKAILGLDDVADMFGSLSMETKKCDVCKTDINKKEAANGAIRCQDCEADIAEQDVQASESVSRKKKEKQGKSKTKKSVKLQGDSKLLHAKKQHRIGARRVVDSDDEEGEDQKGKWIVDKHQQRLPNLGKAGVKTDEDAEGGGEWLVSDEDESNADDSYQSTVSRSTARTTMSPGDSKQGSDEESDVEDDSSSASDSSSPESPVRKPTKLASTKIKHLIDILRRESPTHKIIVFSEFTSMLDLIAPLLDAASPSLPGHARYDGRMAHPMREASLHALRTDSSVRILLCSLRCGSLGLNLTCASRVVLLEPFWNPFVEEQAIDRVHRLNQTEDVVVYKLTVRNSVEERILALQAKKRELASQAVEGSAASGKGGVNKLSMKDILNLFKRDDDVGGVGGGSVPGLDRERVLPMAGTSTSSGPLSVEPQRKVSGGQHARGAAGVGQFGDAYGRRW